MDERKLKKYFSYFLRKGDILFSELMAVEEKIEKLNLDMKIEIASINNRLDKLEK